ncbi:Sec-independent protein translocase protein TatB [Phenylobacterium sp.]|uniref:Sec-independent protein translocase protein TatB n=1 Tax=Phenylobacterium sp. TaxID=1871053 RepID=UPI0039189620
MLPEIGATELLVIAAVALIVVGPKDLPLLMRRIGQFMARIRGMAAEFRASFDDMARQSELDDLRREVEAMRRGQVADLSITDGAMSEAASDIERSLSDVGVQLHPPMSHQYAEPGPSPAPEPIAQPAKAPRKPRATAAKPKAASAKAATPKAPARGRAKKVVE